MPFSGAYGVVVRFWGAACRHKTVANATETTRVSIDFRVLPRSAYQPHEGRFFLGGFYGLLLPDGSMPPLDPTPARQLTSRLKSRQPLRRDASPSPSTSLTSENMPQLQQHPRVQPATPAGDCNR